MTLDDKLVETVDRVVKELKTTRSAFARKALRDALNQVHMKMLEEKHKKGYGRRPVAKEEFGIWESEQDWAERADKGIWPKNKQRARHAPLAMTTP